MIHSLILAMVIACTNPLSGKVDVNGLGTLSLPPGEWTLEHVHSSNDQARWPDCFVFKKLGTRLERITILRYRSHIAPSKPVYLCDSVGDALWNGIPHFIHKKTSNNETLAYMLRKPDDWYAMDRCEGDNP